METSKRVMAILRDRAMKATASKRDVRLYHKAVSLFRGNVAQAR